LKDLEKPTISTKNFFEYMKLRTKTEQKINKLNHLLSVLERVLLKTSIKPEEK
jgi:hypothetical protein